MVTPTRIQEQKIREIRNGRILAIDQADIEVCIANRFYVLEFNTMYNEAASKEFSGNPLIPDKFRWMAANSIPPIEKLVRTLIDVTVTTVHNVFGAEAAREFNNINKDQVISDIKNVTVLNKRIFLTVLVNVKKLKDDAWDLQMGFQVDVQGPVPGAGEVLTRPATNVL